MTNQPVDNITEAKDYVKTAVERAGYNRTKYHLEEETFTAEERHGDAEKPSVHIHAVITEGQSVTNFTKITKAYNIEADNGDLVIKWGFTLPEHHLEEE